mmetsp:Transcript_131393/g.319304  ORF Transcript_131393/g.319304 Transcript_131393/m.319304 type:complete len:233 (-) Transcript_131393:3-701(-)
MRGAPALVAGLGARARELGALGPAPRGCGGKAPCRGRDGRAQTPVAAARAATSATAGVVGASHRGRAAGSREAPAAAAARGRSGALPKRPQAARQELDLLCLAAATRTWRLGQPHHDESLRVRALQDLALGTVHVRVPPRALHHYVVARLRQPVARGARGHGRGRLGPRRRAISAVECEVHLFDDIFPPDVVVVLVVAAHSHRHGWHSPSLPLPRNAGMRAKGRLRRGRGLA